MKCLVERTDLQSQDDTIKVIPFEEGARCADMDKAFSLSKDELLARVKDERVELYSTTIWGTDLARSHEGVARADCQCAFNQEHISYGELQAMFGGR